MTPLEILERDLQVRAKSARRAAAAAGLALVLDEAVGMDGAMYTRGEPEGVVLAVTVNGGGRAFAYFGEPDFRDVDAYYVIDIARLGDDDGYLPYVELSEEAARRLEAAVGVLHEPLIVTPKGSAGGLWTVGLARDPLAHLLIIDGGFLDPRTQREVEALLEDASPATTGWGRCGVCGRDVEIHREGWAYDHEVSRGAGPCLGSGARPVDDDADDEIERPDHDIHDERI